MKTLADSGHRQCLVITEDRELVKSTAGRQQLCQLKTFVGSWSASTGLAQETGGSVPGCAGWLGIPDWANTCTCASRTTELRAWARGRTPW